MQFDFCGSSLLFVFVFSYCHVYFLQTCVHLLALLYEIFSCGFVTLSYGVMGQMLIVSIPNHCLLPYFVSGLCLFLMLFWIGLWLWRFLVKLINLLILKVELPDQTNSFIKIVNNTQDKLIFLCNVERYSVRSKKGGKDQETIQSNLTPDPGFLMGK